MEKYLILLDLDGTLLNDEKKIDDLNRKVIKELIRLGHIIVIVTGRAHYRSQRYYEELGLQSLLVNRNASHIHGPMDNSKEEVIKYFTDGVKEKIFNHPFMKNINKMYLENKNKIFVYKGDTKFYEQYHLCECIDMEEDFQEDINLISFFIDDKLKSIAINFLASLENIYYESFSFDDQVIFNIYPKGIDKSHALKYLSEFYQIPSERIIAMGDEVNDLKFIEQAGIGVAMKNGIDGVKNVAKMITQKTNNENGVGLFLIDYFKLNI